MAPSSDKHTQDLVFLMLVFNKRSQVSLEKWLIVFRTGAGKRQMSLESLTVSESKKEGRGDEGMSEGHRGQPEEAADGQNWNNLSNKINDSHWTMN